MQNNRILYHLRMAAVAVLTVSVMTGCGGDAPDTVAGTSVTADTEISETEETEAVASDETEAAAAAETDETGQDISGAGNTPGIAHETATDDLIDFDVLIAENPDIYAWLYIPDTGIDYPILRASSSDDYYMTHGADGTESDGGCVYTEMYNDVNMCDFNTVIHGSDVNAEDVFGELHRFEEPDFFDAHRTLYIVLPYATLTYEIIAAYTDDASDILRRYDYTSVTGCNRWIADYTGRRALGMNRIEDHVPSTEHSFIVTLAGSPREDGSGQFVVIADIVDDGGCGLTRYLSDEEDGFYESGN